MQFFKLEKTGCHDYRVFDMVVQNGIRCIRSHGFVEDSKTVAPKFEAKIHLS